MEHGDSGKEITGIRFERYPIIKKCPACGSNKGHQSFDIFVCRDCGEWSGIDPIEE